MKEQFSKLGFIFAAIGSAVGLGNIWRFPYMAGMNGGAAFYIAYFIALFIVGMPIMVLEMSAGETYKKSLVKTYQKINPKFKLIAIASILISSVVASYYIVVNGWALAYTFFSFTNYPDFNYFSNSIFSTIFFITIFAIIMYILHKGIKKGIEETSKILMPILFIIMFILTIYSINLPGINKAIYFLFHPKWEYLLNFKTWILAFAQALFSLSVGSGIMLTYATFFKGDFKTSIFWITISDSLIAIFSGLIIFPIVFSYNLNPASGASLAFKTLPLLFNKINIFIGSSFFFLLTIAALTSSISMVELIKESFKDISKKIKNSYLLIILILGILFSLNIKYLEFADLWFGSVALLLQSVILTIIFTWIVNKKKILNTKDAFLNIMYYIAKYITPSLLIILLFFITKI